MFVDDHNLVHGGHPDQIGIRFFKEEVELLRQGHTLTGTNLNGRGTRVRVEMHNVYHNRAFDISTTSGGYLQIELNPETLRRILEGGIVTILPMDVSSSSVSMIVVLANAVCKISGES